MPTSRRDDFLPLAAVAAATAHQAASWATRDALFLSEFDVTWLPRLFLISLVFAVTAVLPLSKRLAKRGFAPFLPAALWASAAVYLLEWALAGRSPRAVAIAVYVQADVIAAL